MPTALLDQIENAVTIEEPPPLAYQETDERLPSASGQFKRDVLALVFFRIGAQQISFQQILAEYMMAYQPVNAIEKRLVEEMFAAER